MKLFRKTLDFFNIHPDHNQRWTLTTLFLTGLLYTYVQPVIAMVIALILGLDHLTALKVVASLLVFVGVGLVNFVPKKQSGNN